MSPTFHYIKITEGKRQCLFPKILPLKKVYNCHEAHVILAIHAPNAFFR